MNLYSGRMRLAGALFAGALSMGFSCVGNTYVRYEPEQRMQLFTQEGMILYVDATNAVARTAGLEIDWFSVADHVDAIFVIKNIRQDAVTVSTRQAVLRFGGERVNNALPEVITLEPGEAKEVWERFELVKRPDRTALWGDVSIHLADVTLGDGRKIDIEVELVLAVMRGAGERGTEHWNQKRPFFEE